MINRYQNLFSLTFLGVVLAVFVIMFASTPIVCGWGPRVNVPWATTSAVVAGSEGDLSIYVTKDHHIFVGTMLVPREALRSELHQIAERTNRERHILISADSSVSFAAVRDVLAASRDAGFDKMSLITFRGTRWDAWHRGGAV
jgi:biopolymer transport protein ExbD